ncbi:MAG: NAD(P)H-binding protein, partial [Actinomycetota bacterium]|nr:NAD(P)H-binding protein [Actinomycetota bacterium]
MKIAVAGGTGFLGRHIAQRLMSSGHEVSVLSRDPSKVTTIAELEHARALKADVTDRYDRAGTENVLAEACGSDVRRFLYVSGAGADPRSSRTWYRAKGIAEASIRAAGIRWAVVRPSWAYGPEDRALNRIAQIARYSPVVPRLGVARQ